MKTNITFIFKFLNFNGFMNLTIKNHNNSIDVVPDNKVQVNMEVDLPTQIYFHISGKNMKADTLLSDTNDIVADKHIYLEKIILDNFELSDLVLQDEIVLVGDDMFKGTYFGINGTAVITLNEENAFKQYIILNYKT